MLYFIRIIIALGKGNLMLTGLAKRMICCFTACAVSFLPVNPGRAQEAGGLPQPGVMVPLSRSVQVPLLKGIRLDANNPFHLEFVLNQGEAAAERSQLTNEAQRLIKYFLAAITVPEKDLWVNLSPYEKECIMPEGFAQTEMGRDLLSQDYLLKQIMASVIYPEGSIGREFWDKVYARANAMYGTTDVPVDTFNKVWIVPQKAVLYENKDGAFIVEGRLKVMLESDYLAMENNRMPDAQGHRALSFYEQPGRLAKEALREIIIPVLEKEVNEGQNFADLRQAYYSLMLATWFKEKVRGGLFRFYVDQNKTAGIDIADRNAREKIWERYVQAFKKGVYRYVKEEYDPLLKETIPRKYFSGGITAMGLERTLERTQDLAMVPVSISERDFIVSVALDAAMASRNSTARRYFEVNAQGRLSELQVRQAVFGEGIDGWLLQHRKNGRKEELEQIVAEFFKDREFRDAVGAMAKEDVPVEIIRYAVRHQIALGTKSMGTFLEAMRKEARKYGLEKKMPAFSMTISGYVQLIVILADRRVQEYLDGEQFDKMPASERLAELVERIGEFGLVLGSSSLGNIHGALPFQLSSRVTRDRIHKVAVSKNIYDQLKTALADERVQVYLDSEEFEKMPAGERLAGLVEKIRELQIVLENDSLSQIHSALPQQLSAKVRKDDVHMVQLSKAVYDQLRAALADERMQVFLDSEDFLMLPAADRLAGLLEKIRELGSKLDTDNLGQIYSGLPQQLSRRVGREAIYKVELPKVVYDQLRMALADSRVQAYLDSEEFDSAPGSERLALLVEKIRESGLKLETNNLGKVYSGLPQRLSRKILKSDIQMVQLAKAVYDQLRAALADKRVQAYLDSEAFDKTPGSERLVVLVETIHGLGLALETDNLAHIHAALPQQLSVKVKREAIQKVDLSKLVYDQLQAALADERMQAYLDGDEFERMPAGERLAELAGKIRELGLKLESDNLGKIYSGLPFRLSDKVRKSDIQLIDLPKSVYDQLRAALADKRVQAYLDGEEFASAMPADRLVGLVNSIRRAGLKLESDNLGGLHSALPERLSIKVTKGFLQRIELSKEVYDQLRLALADGRVQAYLDSEEFAKIPSSDRLADLVGSIQNFGLKLDSDSLGQIFNALPQQLSGKVSKQSIETVQLTKPVYDQLRAALADKRVQAYLDGDVFENMPVRERLVALVSTMRELGFNINNESLSKIFSGLPEQLSPKVNRGMLQTVILSQAVFDQLRAALMDERVRDYLDSEEFEQTLPERRLAGLVEKIREFGLELGTESLLGVFTGLPDNIRSRFKFMPSSKNDADAAMAQQQGGIDFRPGRLDSSGPDGGRFLINPEFFQRLTDAAGLTPVILHIQPMNASAATFIGRRLPEAP